jgi:hypothetical protein
MNLQPYFLFYHDAVRSELRQGVACVSLEVTVQIALVGEHEFVYKLLKTLMAIHQCNLQLDYCIMIYNLFCILSAGTLAYRV